VSPPSRRTGSGESNQHFRIFFIRRKKMKEKVVLIQGAMDTEIEYFLEKIQDKEKITIAGYDFWRGILNNRKIVISQTLVGVVNATTATTIGILKFHPDVVINQGIAGAHRTDIHTGDIIIGKECCNINAYEMPMKKKEEGSNPFEWKPNKRAKNVQKADEELLEKIEKKLRQHTKKQVYLGILGSGDVFNRETDRINWIHDTFCNDSEDMESIGMYTVCNQFQVPCVGVRIISNNELLEEPLDEKQATELQKSLVEILPEI